MRQPVEISIELTAQELLAPPPPQHLVAIDDVCAVDLIATPPVAANAATAPSAPDDQYIEIELTPQEMDALLGGEPIPR